MNKSKFKNGQKGEIGTAVAIALFLALQVSLHGYNQLIDRSDCEIDEYSTECAKPRSNI